MVQISVLGAVRVAYEGQELAIGGPKRRAVLAMLALTAPRPCSPEHLVDGLWGDDPPESVRNGLQVSVTRLRTVLQPCGVQIARVGHGYALRGSYRVDAAEFEQAVAEGRAALRAGDVARSARLLAAGVELWHGRALEGLDGLPFAQRARVSLEATRRAALLDLADAHMRVGDPAVAVRVSQLLVDEHPYDERGWISLATAQYWSGRQDLALEACRRARDVLIDGLGLDPTAALAEVEDAVLNHCLPDQRVGAAQQPDPDPGGLPLPSLPEPFVGRDDLVDTVIHRLGQAQSLVSLLGIGGIGKTSVAVASAHRLAASGRRVVFCPLETELDAQSAAEHVCRLVGLDPGADAVQALIESDALDVLVLDSVEQATGIGEAFERLVRARPDVDVLATSRRPLGVRVEHVISVPPLSLASTDAALSPAEQVFLSHAERVRPGIAQGSAQPVRELCSMLEGIPLALELAAARTRALTPHQLLARFQDRREAMLGSAEPAGAARQASLRVVLRDSVLALGASAQRLFELFGSLDGWVSLEILERLADGWVEDFDAAIEELVGWGLVTLDLTGRASMKGPIREYAATLGPRDRMGRRVVAHAVALVQLHSTRLFGSDAPDALDALRRDEDTALIGLAIAVQTGDAASAAALATGLNRYWLLTGRLAEGRRWLARASAMTGHTAADSAVLGILSGTFDSYVNDPETARVLGAALHTAGTIGLPADRIVVNGWCCLAAFAAHHGDFDAAEAAAATAAHLASTSGDPHLVALARDLDGHIASYLGDHQRAFESKLAGIVDARRSGDLYDLVNLLMTAAGDLLYLDRPEEAIAFADEAFDLTAGLEVGPLLGGILLVRGSSLLTVGHVAPARGNLVQALRIARDHDPDVLAMADILTTLGACMTLQLDDAGACRCVGAGRAIYSDHGISARERLARPITDAIDLLEARLGAPTFTALAALGAADQGRTVDRLLGDLADG